MGLIFSFPVRAFGAGPWDPDARYLSLKTPHFDVVFTEGYGSLAARTARIAEDLWPYMAERYVWRPPRITIILDDQTDFANGSARVLPNRVVTLFVTAPIRTSGLEDYDDWLYTVLNHELAHVFHLDMAYGLAGVGRFIMGPYVAMNGYAAAWSVEGLAVYEETISSGAGRGRSTYVDMVLRVAALEGVFPDVDQGYRAYPRWPFGNTAYFFGGRFHLWLATRFGEAGILDYHRAYAANPIPYLSILPARQVFGSSLESLWKGFARETTEEAQVLAKLIESARPPGEPEARRLTRHGGQSVGPRVLPDGSGIVFSAFSPVDGPRVRVIPLQGGPEDVLLNDTLSQAVAFTPDGSAFYYQQTEINQRFYRHDQLLRFDLESRRVEAVRLAEGVDTEAFQAPSGALRARDPDVSPDGRKLVFVQTHRAMNRLVLAQLDGHRTRIRPRVLIPGSPDVQLASPRFAPNGGQVALSRFAGGRRDVVLADLDGALRFITQDRAQDVDPTWSPDGRWLVFSSDRSGVYDLYAFDMHTEELRRLTHRIGGAFQPSVSPDGDTLVFRGYTAAGFDVFAMPFRPLEAPAVDRAPEPPLARDRRPRAFPPRHPSAPPPPPPARPIGTPLAEADVPADWEIAEYAAHRTLLPFVGAVGGSNWNLLPSLVATERELLIGLTHFGQDALQTHRYAISARYGTFSEFLGGSLFYANDTLEPTFSLFASADAVTFARVAFKAAGADVNCAFHGFTTDSDGRELCFATEGGTYVERRLSVGGSIGLPLLQRHFISVGYSFEVRDPARSLAAGTLDEFLPAQGRFARVTLGYSYANVRRFPYSISPERGPSFSASLSALAGGLGSDFDQILVNLDGRYYWDLPWASNHVLALRLTAGVGGGPDLAERFRLGGAAGASVLSTTTRNFFPLRGLASAVLSGSGQVSGTIEYRAPLFRVDRGLGTFPFTLSAVHAAAFVDAGRTFDALENLPRDIESTLGLSVGLELRADALLAFVTPLTFRVGAAWPMLLPAALRRGADTEEFYFQLGSAF
ncbi:MAG: BamA/TamA family outer membrane protein [Myxococcota bacterium]